MKKTTIYVPANLRAIIKSRAAIQGLYGYQYISRLVLEEAERTQHSSGVCPLASRADVPSAAQPPTEQCPSP